MAPIVADPGRPAADTGASNVLYGFIRAGPLHQVTSDALIGSTPDIIGSEDVACKEQGAPPR